MPLVVVFVVGVPRVVGVARVVVARVVDEAFRPKSDSLGNVDNGGGIASAGNLLSLSPLFRLRGVGEL